MFITPTSLSLDINTKLLIKGNGTPSVMGGSPAIILDEVGNNININGAVNISTTVSRYDINSIWFNSNDGYIATDSSSIYTLNTSDFTIEFWLYANSTITGNVIVSNVIGSTYTTNDWKMIFNNNNVQLSIFNSGLTLQSLNHITTNTWYHIAIVREGSLFTLFVNGVVNSTFTYSGSVDNGVSNIIKLGGITAGTTMDGYIDDFRLSNIARYHTNFTPPTSDYS
jgi:hypothetical protein